VTSHSHRASARCRTTIRNGNRFNGFIFWSHNTEAVDYVETVETVSGFIAKLTPG